MANELARKLINAGVHFGHSSSRWNPKMAPYIFSKRGKIHIIDVRQTFKGVLIAKKLLVDIVSSGRDVIFVGTKRQAQKAVEKAAEKCGMHYISERWLGGMLTNYRTIRSRLQRLEELEAMQESGTLDKESKKQASRLKREMNKIKTNHDRVRKMSKLPGVVVVVDVRKEHIALAEAKKLGIATIGLIDTNSDPDSVDVAIPANDDSIRAVDIILDQLADAVCIGKTMSITKERTDEKPKRVRSSRTVTARAEGAEQATTTTETPFQEPKVETPSPEAPVQEPKQEAAQEESPKEESNQ